MIGVWPRRDEGVPRLCANLMHGSVHRVSECLALRVKDLDVERREILVRSGKVTRIVASPSAIRISALLHPEWELSLGRLDKALKIQGH